MGRWHRSFPARQLRVRPLACFALVFLLGLIFADRWTPSIECCAITLAAALIAVCALAIARRRLAAALLLVGFAAGMGRMTLAQQAVPRVDTLFSVDMTGQVISEPFTNPDTGRVISRFKLESANGEPSDLCLRLYLRGDEEPLRTITCGQRLSLTGHIWESDPVTNPYEFDFGAYLRRNGMSAIATAKIEDVTILGTRESPRTRLIAIRHAIAAQIDLLFPDSAPMVRALVLGDRSLISDEMRKCLNATGTAHLIAISGLHVTVLAFALSLAFGLFLPRRIANLAVLLPLILYGGLIGFTPSFLRALVMFAVLSGSPIAGLPSDPFTRLGAALLLCLVIRPMDIGDAGLVLSFAASAGILLLFPPIQALLGLEPIHHRIRHEGKRHRRLRRLLVYFADTLCASVAAQLMTLPAVVAWFGVQSVISLPFNLICAPMCMIGYILSLIVLVISAVLLPVGLLAARVPDAILAALLSITRFSLGLPVSTVRIGRYPALLVLIHIGIAVAASEMSRIRPGIRRFLPLALLAVAGLSSIITWAQAWPFSVTFLDAGQADCAILRTRGHTWVFDTGDTYTPAADYLGATCLHLDGVVLSHPHQDHAGGLPDILDAFKPDAIYVPVGWFDEEIISPDVIKSIQRAIDLDIPIIPLHAGMTVPLSDTCEMAVWSPDAGIRPESVNDMSLLTLVSCEGRSVLITGDLTMSGEPDDVPDCDVLKVAHHGANNASSSHFLEEASPAIAVITVGENSFGHPGEEALRRLDACGARILRTDMLGAITLRPEGEGWRINTYLEAPHDLE